MKKIVSLIVMAGIIALMQFHVMKGFIPDGYRWFESLIAFMAMAGMLWWNAPSTRS